MDFSFIDKGTIKAIAVSVIGGYLLARLLGKSGLDFETKCQPQTKARTEAPPFPGVDRTWRIPLASGLDGTKQTLAWMRWLVRRDASDLYVRRFAENLIAECPGHAVDCEIAALFKFVRDSITFRRDPAEVERVQDARRTILFRAGDCDDKSVLLGSLLASLGYKSCFSLLGSKPGNYSHVFISTFTPRGWLALDPTNERAEVGWQGVAPAVAHYPIF